MGRVYDVFMVCTVCACDCIPKHPTPSPIELCYYFDFQYFELHVYTCIHTCVACYCRWPSKTNLDIGTCANVNVPFV